MNEFNTPKLSIKYFIVGLCIFSLVGIFQQSIAYDLGFILGYLICLLSFYFTIKITDIIMETKSSIIMMILMMVGKLILYALGFIAAFKIPNFINVIGVFFGYFVIQITIKVETLVRRKEE